MKTPEANIYRAVVITGTVGAGKTTTSKALVDVFARHDIPNAGIDMDYLRQYWPVPSDDPFGVKMGLVNLASVVANYRDNHINTLVLADVVTSEIIANGLRHALKGYRVHIVRLRANPDVLAQRLRDRESGQAAEWFLAQAPRLQDEMDANRIGDVVIDVNDETPEQVAEMIAVRLELLKRGPGHMARVE